MAIITGEQSKGARKSLGLSQHAVATEAGLSRTHISYLEGPGSGMPHEEFQRALRQFYEERGVLEPEPESAEPPPAPAAADDSNGFLFSGSHTEEEREAILQEIEANDEAAAELLQSRFNDGLMFRPLQNAKRKFYRLWARNWHLCTVLQGLDALPDAPAEEPDTEDGPALLGEVIAYELAQLGAEDASIGAADEGEVA